MKITNKYGLPESMFNFALKDTYDAGKSNITVTQLIDSPRVVALRKKHWDDIEEDVSDRLWALMGRALHHVMEFSNAQSVIAEERLFAKREGWIISGQIDAQVVIRSNPPVVDLGDYKFTSVWAVMNEKPEWERQLNLYAWLVEEAKPLAVVNKLFVYAMCRDWTKRDTVRVGYPQTPLVIMPIPVWTQEQREAYLMERLRLHAETDVDAVLDKEPPPCTPEEQWRREATYAVIKPGRKRAIRVFDNLAEAEAFDSTTGETVIDIRPAQPIRCINDYCRVSQWCSQFKQESKNDI